MVALNADEWQHLGGRPRRHRRSAIVFGVARDHIAGTDAKRRHDVNRILVVGEAQRKRVRELPDAVFLSKPGARGVTIQCRASRGAE